MSRELTYFPSHTTAACWRGCVRRWHAAYSTLAIVATTGGVGVRLIQPGIASVVWNMCDLRAGVARVDL